MRRATVGPPTIRNTHPFVDGPWALIHHGTVPHFDRLRPRLVAALPAGRRAAIRGETDSEHLFHLLRHLQDEEPDRPALDVLRRGLRQIVAWARAIDPAAGIGLNVILSDGEQMIGSRLGRTLYWVERRDVQDCEICGFPHVRHDPRRDYRAVVVASEPISHEDWREVPEASVYRVTDRFELEIEPL